MKLKDYALLLSLIALLVLWPSIDRLVIKKYFFPHSSTTATATTNTTSYAESTPAQPAEIAAAPETGPITTPTAETPAPTEDIPEETVVLDNGHIAVTFSSRGGTIAETILTEYRETRDQASGPVVLDFRGQRSLAYTGLPGFTDLNTFNAQLDEQNKTVVYERSTEDGLTLRRTLRLDDRYSVHVTDELKNTGASHVALPQYGLTLGMMQNDSPLDSSGGMAFLGVDTLSPGGEGVQHWSKKIPSWFKEEVEDKGLPKLPVQIERQPRERAVDWVAVKNKYFVQILTPDDGAEACYVYARREVTEREKSNPDYQPKMTPVKEVAATVYFPQHALGPGETFTRTMQYYVGPKKYSELHAMRLHQVDVMEFGFWGFVGKYLLITLNLIHDYLWPHNYGLAIILLTVIIRVLFWPVTHKSTESMRKMQAVQPLINQIREKYKDNPQKQQTEIMALYKAHKVNPLGGCLPMLVQIPVFIALFVVLRSAIELRFASFLWIHDLSEPERLFANVLPIPLNILPILMALTMAWQQKLTPSGTTDPAQQKMMMIMMPGMMLVFLYNFASGLALYWTTQNVLMIVQQLVYQRRKNKKAE